MTLHCEVNYLQMMCKQPSVISTKYLQLAHLLQFFSFANCIIKRSSFALSSSPSLLYSSQLNPECYSTLHAAQNNLRQLEHSDLVTTSSPSSTISTEQSLNGQYNFCASSNIDSQNAFSHLSYAIELIIVQLEL